jgi:hypothetical protein
MYEVCCLFIASFTRKSTYDHSVWFGRMAASRDADGITMPMLLLPFAANEAHFCQ